MMNNSIQGAFGETRKLFATYVGNLKGDGSSLSYEQWMEYPTDLKAAALFVNFYDTITLAHYKAKSFFVEEESAVETELQYLMKNVPLIEKDSRKFTGAYIYRVSYNCLYCISHDIKREIERWEREISNVVGYDGDELDLFDIVQSNILDGESDLSSRSFWKIIEQMGPETMKVVNWLLNEEQSLEKAKAFRRKDPRTLPTWDKKPEYEKRQMVMTYEACKNNYEIDPLKEISVTMERAEEIIEELKLALEMFKDVYYNN